MVPSALDAKPRAAKLQVSLYGYPAQAYASFLVVFLSSASLPQNQEESQETEKIVSYSDFFARFAADSAIAAKYCAQGVLFASTASPSASTSVAFGGTNELSSLNKARQIKSKISK